MLGRFWACRRRMARSLLTHSPMTTMPRTKMRCHGYGESTLHQRGRQWYDRWVHRLTFTPPSSWVCWSLKNFFFYHSSGPAARPPHAFPCFWRCEVQVGYWTSKACVGVRPWSAPRKRTHQVHTTQLSHTTLPDGGARDHVPQTKATGSIFGERRSGLTNQMFFLLTGISTSALETNLFS